MLIELLIGSSNARNYISKIGVILTNSSVSRVRRSESAYFEAQRDFMWNKVFVIPMSPHPLPTFP